MITRILCILFSLLTLGCGTTQAKKHETKNARVTYYCASEDKRWGAKTANGGHIRPYRTVAARRSVPFGTVVRIPYLAKFLGTPDKDFVVEDRGTAVETRCAAKRFGVGMEVIDVAVPTRRIVKYLAAVVPPVLPVEM